MNKWYWTWYLPSVVRTIAYMLQASEYNIVSYWQWLCRVQDLRVVSKRNSLRMTAKAKLIRAFLATAYLLLWVSVVILLYVGIRDSHYALVLGGMSVLLLLPWLLSLAVVPLVWVGETCMQRPRTRRTIRAATRKIAQHPGRKIAIAGSYGKTTMKETLKTILSVKLDVAATPGNLNTPLGTVKFAGHLSGQEEVVIFELGESHTGDVAELCEITQPSIGVVTGINEAHLASFGSLENTVATVFELGEYLGDKPLYKNAESELVLKEIAADDPLAYSARGVNGWRVRDVSSGLDGTKFRAQKDEIDIELHSGLLGVHQVGPLIACVDIAYQLGLSPEQIVEGVGYTKPFAHRMQPRQALSGAWIIDDTYNGNPQGVAVGLEFLKQADVSGRKIYVTPGLVEQGDATKQVHMAIGEQAAFCDEVVLMRNSTTDFIRAGLKKAQFVGKLTVIDDPLAFYRQIDGYIERGDVALLQNDWPDNYS